MTYTDEQLLDGCRNGESWALRAVESFITPIIRRRLYERDAWEDARQHCLLDCLRTFERADTITHFWALVRRVTVCKVIDLNRRKQVRERHVALPSDNTDEEESDRRSTAVTPGHDQAFEDRDMFEYVFRRLDPVCQQLMEGLFLRDLDYADLEGETGMSLGNMRVKLKRCRERARELREDLKNLPG